MLDSKDKSSEPATQYQPAPPNAPQPVYSPQPARTGNTALCQTTGKPIYEVQGGQWFYEN